MTPKEKLHKWIIRNARWVDICRLNLWIRDLEGLPNNIRWEAIRTISTNLEKEKENIKINIWFNEHGNSEPKLILTS